MQLLTIALNNNMVIKSNMVNNMRSATQILPGYYDRTVPAFRPRLSICGKKLQQKREAI
jgi:hypothetical protein